MAVGRKIIAVFVGILASAVMADADMMPVSAVDTACLPPVTAASQPDPESTGLSVLFGRPDLADLGSLPVIFPGEVESQADATRATPMIRTDEQDSLSLCLFALLGLGLCKSAVCQKIVFRHYP